ncbi:MULTISPECIES: glutamate racemase [Tenacibaculum]|uniref:glutamate racemase n=1 Tax=Tenacibaculum TaxID=104267 RepID=UPI001F0AAA10|nr:MULTISPECIES: glutamate racemase [Tenacibaculum]MCH3880982.1 glutamate racemase [Tenacibaculum aquimarinum]MDO6599418.1 glutamate racemase [Tenacibaculum sp. 1_MG-2023]
MTKSNPQQPIGIFDSGIGGTSIWKEINNLLPNEETIYLSDSKNAPYGQKSKDAIIELSIKNTEFLLNKNCKTIVVACNTATTNAIKYLRKNYDIPFIGIEPAIKPASLKTKTNCIGILATKGTLNSELFEKTSSNIDATIKIIEQVGEGLVELIEDGNIDSVKMTTLLKSYLQPMMLQKMDCLVLGCTHYPYLISQIKNIVGKNVNIIDSGEAVAKQTKAILEKHKLINLNRRMKTHTFYINKNSDVLRTILRKSKSVRIEELTF